MWNWSIFHRYGILVGIQYSERFCFIFPPSRFSFHYCSWKNSYWTNLMHMKLSWEINFFEGLEILLLNKFLAVTRARKTEWIVAAQESTMIFNY